MLFRDDINKIIYVTSHKCGCSTISAFLMELYGYEIVDRPLYYATELNEMGYCKVNKDLHKNYFKILILRNPIKRFFSGLYQDCTGLNKHKFFKINISIKELLVIIDDINNQNNQQNNLNDTKLSKIKNLITQNNQLHTHLKPQYYELLEHFDLFDKIGFKFDKVIDLENFDKEMQNIKTSIFDNKISIPQNKKNVKKYTNVSFNLSKIKVSDLCNLKEFPPTNPNEEIIGLIKIAYKIDYDLIDKYNISFDEKVE